MLAILMSLLAANSGGGGAAVPANPPYNEPPAYSRGYPVPNPIAFDIYKTQMLALRRDALAEQKQDGGKLTPQHKQDIQYRIDHIEKVFHQRNDVGRFSTAGRNAAAATANPGVVSPATASTASTEASTAAADSAR